MIIPYEGEPIVADLMVAIEQNLSVPADAQRLVFRGQELHNAREQSLRCFGIYNSSLVRLVGRKAFIINN